MSRASELDRWDDLCAGFDALVELDDGARAERLAAIGASDPATRRALEELLEADASAGTRLAAIESLLGTARPMPRPDAIGNADVLRLVGRTIAHFRVVEQLAAGGMGVVYRAIDTNLGRPVALKFPLPGQHLDGHVRERFLREARAAGALDHPNVCSIFESGETDDGQLFLAMPLYEGETLKARIAREGPLPLGEALAIAVQIARGLHAAHRAGIIHRDLKPANAIILPDGGLKILDFGVARVGDVTLTKSHGTLGTVSYMAPEQVRGDQLDGRADLWALGVLLFEMLTGRRPFEGEHEIAIAHAIVNSSPVRPSVLRPEISRELDTLVLRLLARQPGNRPASADVVATELTALESKSISRHTRRWRMPFIGSTRRTRVFGVIAIGVVAVGTVALLMQAGAAGGSIQPRIVAVLPFQSRSESNDTDHLAAALAGEMASQLSRLNAVAIPGDWVASAYDRADKPALDIAGELGATAVVRGNVRRAGNDVLLEVELIDVNRKGRVWTREYRGPSNTVLALQQSAMEGIVAALRIDVTRAERAMLMQVPTRSSEAYDLYLRGRAAHIAAAPGSLTQPQNPNQPQLENLQLAQSYYARARESDPDFAVARARLALMHLALARYDRTSARSDQARLEAEAALRIHPALPEAHEALGSYWDLRAEDSNAANEFTRALAARPNAADLLVSLGANLRQLGRWEEAVNVFERASRLDPRSRTAHNQAALTYGRLRRYDQSITHWDQLIALDPADPFPQIIRGFNYLRLGDLDSLDAAISRIPLGRDFGGPSTRTQGMVTYARYTVHRIMGRHVPALASLDSARFAISFDQLLYVPVALMRAQTLERMGDTTRARANYEVARALLEDSVAAHPREPRMRVALGLAFAGLGRRADAMREARTAVELAPVAKNSPVATAAMGGAVEIYAQLGEADAAFELLELLLSMPAGREVSIPLLRLDPTYARLRVDPRFNSLVSRFSRN